MRILRPGRALLFLVAAAPCLAAPAIRQEPRIALEIDAVLVGADGGRSIGTRQLEVPPTGHGEADFPVPLPESAGGAATLHLEARGVARPEGEVQEVTVAALLSLGSGRTVTAERTLSLTEGAASLFEVFGEEKARLVLAVRGERVTRPVVRESSGVGAPVRFHLVVERVIGERSIPVESNDLSSFLGEDVEYSFRRGEGAASETVRLVLNVQQILGDVAEVATDVSASLPGASAPILMSHQERLFATRGAVSTITVVNGDPPAGYRFLVTPRF